MNIRTLLAVAFLVVSAREGHAWHTRSPAGMRLDTFRQLQQRVRNLPVIGRSQGLGAEAGTFLGLGLRAGRRELVSGGKKQVGVEISPFQTGHPTLLTLNAHSYDNTFVRNTGWAYGGPELDSRRSPFPLFEFSGGHRFDRPEYNGETWEAGVGIQLGRESGMYKAGHTKTLGVPTKATSRNFIHLSVSVPRWLSPKTDLLRMAERGERLARRASRRGAASASELTQMADLQQSIETGIRAHKELVKAAFDEASRRYHHGTVSPRQDRYLLPVDTRF